MISIYTYSDENHTFELETLKEIDGLEKILDGRTCWVNIDNLSKDILKNIEVMLCLHPTTMMDLTDKDARAKLVDNGEYTNCVANTITFSQAGRLRVSKVNIIVWKNIIFTVCKNPNILLGDTVQILTRKLEKKPKVSNIYYLILNDILDRYFETMEVINKNIDILESEIMADNKPEHLNMVHQIKSDIVTIKRTLWPMRELTSLILRGVCPYLSDDVYMRELYDHVCELYDMVESCREMLGSLTDLYLSNINTKMSEVMKTLTVVSTIFIPITFVVGLYGMNFRYMPEINWVYGYPTVLILMGAIVMGMMWYFKKKDWF